jgi:flagellar biosynthetic protein FliO
MDGGAAVGSVSLLKMMAALFFVVGLIFLTAWLFRRLNGAHLRRPGAARTSMRLAESLPLGERRFLSVVEVGRRRFLLGVAPQAVSLLAELEPMDPAGTAETPAPGEFAGLLDKARRVLQRGGK